MPELYKKTLMHFLFSFVLALVSPHDWTRRLSKSTPSVSCRESLERMSLSKGSSKFSGTLSRKESLQLRALNKPFTQLFVKFSVMIVLNSDSEYDCFTIVLRSYRFLCYLSLFIMLYRWRRRISFLNFSFFS